MKIICTVENIRTAVAATERFTGRHVTIPIISHILFIVKEKKISLNATNLETGIEYTIPGKIQKPGAVTTSAKQFSQILQSLANEENITLEATHQKLILTTSQSDITLLSLNPEDFPTLPAIKKEHSFRVGTSQLSAALSQVLPAVAATDLKPELAGVLITTSPGTIVLTATDSFRLSEKTITNADGVEDTTNCIVPSRTLNELFRILPEDAELEVNVGEHQIVFSWNGKRILSRLIDGAYPPYKNLLPKAYETTLVVHRDELLRNIHLASVFASRLNDVTLRYSPTGLEVTTTNTETGNATSRLDARGRGASGTVVFNYRYLLDGLTSTGASDIILNLNGVSGPALIQSPGDNSFLYLLMPIRSV